MVADDCRQEQQGQTGTGPAASFVPEKPGKPPDFLCPIAAIFPLPMTGDSFSCHHTSILLCVDKCLAGNKIPRRL